MNANDYRICYCSSVLTCGNPFDFGAAAGIVQVSGAIGGNVYVCRRGSPCVVNIQGWRLTPFDRLKVI